MRITYLAVWSGGPSTGVGRKLLAQCRAWREAGHDVRLMLLTKDPAWAETTIEVKHQIACWQRLSELPAAWLALRRACLARDAEVLYVRQMMWLPGLGRLMRRQPAVVEIQTDDLAELASLRVMGPLNRCTRRWLLDAAAGFVFMTDELARLPHYRSQGQPRVAIANAVPDGPMLPPVPPEAPPRLIFLGSPGKAWHGVDRLETLARALPEMQVDVVGPEALAGRVSPPNLTWHGWLDRERYLPLMAQAVAGIGSLGLARNGMRQACPLKVREYLAGGLPVILAYDDPDLPDGTPHALCIPATPEGISAAAALLRDFVQAWHGRRVDPLDLGHLRLPAKEAARLAFLASVAAGG